MLLLPFDHQLNPKRSQFSTKPSATPVPTFDPRKTNQACIRQAPVQGQCASSWAIAAADSLADRFCVSGHAEAKDLSSEYLLACDSENYGCGGEYVAEAWFYLQTVGTVTEQCFPYASVNGKVPSCPNQCINGASLKYYMCQKSSIRELSYSPDEIREEIKKYGSVSMSMIVYTDFLYYKGGVYKHIYGDDIGRHAVRAIGYGEENGAPYWLCANSWSQSWGINGWFKIAVGEADVEGDVWTCTPKLVSDA